MFISINTPGGPINGHLSIVKPRRNTPTAERHKWTCVPKRGQQAICLKCGCEKRYQLDYAISYRVAGESALNILRPTCNGQNQRPQILSLALR